MSSRKEIALKKINLRKSGLELGPLDSPLILKSESDVFYVDHTSTEELQKKYRNEPVTLNKIVAVDYVVGSQTLRRAVRGKKFDYIVASHVIEHIPDIISWFQDMAAVLKPNGIVSFVIPDKRFTFDITRNNSRPGDVLGAYLEKHKKAATSTLYDYFSEHRNNVIADEVWNNPYRDFSKKPRRYKETEAYQMCLDNLKPDRYVDSHCHVFTPYSFFEIIKSLILHDLFPFEIIEFVDTPQNLLEFYVTFRKSNGSAARKLASVPKLKRPYTTLQTETELRRIKNELAKTQAELNHVLASKSWKVTKPLRAVLRALP